MDIDEYITKLTKKIDMLVSVFSKYNFNEEAKVRYVSSLMRFQNNPNIFMAIDELATGSKFPYIQDIIDHVNAVTRRNAPRIDKRLGPAVENPEETRKSALLSIMWLYYSNMYSRGDLNGDLALNMVLEPFKRMFPGEQFSIDKLELEFPREKVESWMNHQKQVNP